MMNKPVSKSVQSAAAEALSRSKGEPKWLTRLRGNAAQAAEGLEWPKPDKIRLDRWALDARGRYLPADEMCDSEELPGSIRGLAPEDSASGLIVQRNSSVVLKRLSVELKSKGVILTDLETAAREHTEVLKTHLFSAVNWEENKLTALHAAWWNGGIFVYVPKHVELELPIQALLFSDDAEAAFAPHILIVADSHSRISYIDHVVSEPGDGLPPAIHQSIVEVIVKPGARVQFASIHHLADNVVDLTLRRAIVEQGGRIEWIIGDLSDGNVFSDTRSSLHGSGSTSDAKVISIGAGSQQLSLTTQAVHFGKRTDSQMVTRAVMKERGTAIINGVTKIEKGASKANGEQTEKVLMLSPKARGDANPILLIDEDDVTAGHAASVGKVSPEQIYYLMSRGIQREEAERLVVQGFLAPIVSGIPAQSVRERLKRLLETKLQSGTQSSEGQLR